MPADTDQKLELKSFWGFLARYSEVKREGNTIDITLVIGSPDDSFPLDKAMTKAREIEKKYDLVSAAHCIAVLGPYPISEHNYEHYHPRIRGRDYNKT